MNASKAALFLLFLGVAQAQNRQGIRFDPWDRIHQSFCITEKTYNSAGQLISTAPMLGRAVDIYFEYTRGSGTHTHEVGGTNRPNHIWETPIQANTAIDARFPGEGCVNFYMHPPKNQAFSGKITTHLGPSSNALPLTPVASDIVDNDLRGVDHGANGAEKPLTRLQASQFFMEQTLPTDLRHCDEFGVCNYSRYGTQESVRQMKAIAYIYTTSLQNTSHFLLNVMRGALLWDGDADNEHVAGSDSAKYFAWGIGRGDEGHRHGTGWDIENPRRVYPPSGYDLEKDVVWNVFKTSVLEAGCHFGLFGPDSGIIMTNLIDSPNFWKTRDVVHINCASSWQ